MSTDKVWDRVGTLLAEHNAAAEQKVDALLLRNKLESDEGACTVPALREVTWETLRKHGLPDALAKAVATIFRTTPGDKAGLAMPRVGNRRTKHSADNLDHRQLVDEFEPADWDSPLGQVLASRAKNQPVLVFNDDGSLNRDATYQVLLEIRAGELPQETVTVNSVPMTIYRVGESPGEFRLIHPLTGSELRLNGIAVEDGLNWGELAEDARSVLVTARLETHEINPKTIGSDRMGLITFFTALKQGGVATAMSLAPRAYQLVQQRKVTGGNPPLKTVVRRKSLPAPKGDPSRVIYGQEVQS